LGRLSSLSASVVNGMVGLTSQSQPAGSGCGASSASQGYDTRGNVVAFDDVNGNRTCYAYDTTRNLRTITLEGLPNTTACPANLAAYVPDTSDAGRPQRKLTKTWHPDWELETQRAEPGKLTTNLYNGQPDPFNGGTLASCAPAAAVLPDGKPIAVLCKRVEQATSDQTGGRGLSLVGTSSTAGDPNFASVTLLLKGDVGNGMSVETDSSAHARARQLGEEQVRRLLHFLRWTRKLLEHPELARLLVRNR
jgi:YD repeat-containing protein